MSIDHPKAIAAREAAERRREAQAFMKANIAEARRQGLKFIHVDKHTFCYRVDVQNVVEISSTIRNPKDRPSPLIGKYEALKRFSDKNRMLLRVRNHIGIEPLLRCIAREY